MPRQDTGAAIHVNDQSVDEGQDESHLVSDADYAVFEVPKVAGRRLVKGYQSNVDEPTATDDMAASSQTIP